MHQEQRDIKIGLLPRHQDPFPGNEAWNVDPNVKVRSTLPRHGADGLIEHRAEAVGTQGGTPAVDRILGRVTGMPNLDQDTYHRRTRPVEDPKTQLELGAVRRDGRSTGKIRRTLRRTAGGARTVDNYGGLKPRRTCPSRPTGFLGAVRASREQQHRNQGKKT